MWLLIITLAFTGGGTSSNSIEFTSKDSCLTARDRLLQVNNSFPRKLYIFDAFCTKK